MKHLQEICICMHNNFIVLYIMKLKFVDGPSLYVGWPSPRQIAGYGVDVGDHRVG